MTTFKIGSMTKFNNKYRIESNRLRYWDYSDTGLYFITICVEEHESIFGDIIKGEMILSEYGEIVKNEILKMNDYHPRAFVDEWVVMPNHIHLLIELIDEDDVERRDNGRNVEVGKIHVEKIHEFSQCMTHDA